MLQFMVNNSTPQVILKVVVCVAVELYYVVLYTDMLKCSKHVQRELQRPQVFIASALVPCTCMYKNATRDHSARAVSPKLSANSHRVEVWCSYAV